MKLELTNTIPEARKFETLEEGSHVMGLVNIKNVEKAGFKDKSEKVPAFRFVFRSQANPQAYINHDVTSASSKKSNLFKTLRLMTGGKLKDEVPRAELFELMKECVGGWYLVMVECEPWAKNPDVVFARVVSNQITPYLTGNKEFGTVEEVFGGISSDAVEDPEYTEEPEEEEDSQDELPF